MSLTVGGANGTLAATVAPADATNKNVTWVSSSPSVATVSGAGLNATVSPVAAGTAAIIVTTQDGGFVATCNVTVAAANVPVTGISVAPAIMSLTVGGANGTLAATLSPADATNKTVTWVSSSPSVAAVSGAGLNATVSPVAAGAVTITVWTVDGGFQAICYVTVTADIVHVTGVTLSPTTLSLPPGTVGILTATISPADATNKNVVWMSSNPVVAAVEQTTSLTTIVRGVVAGNALITVTTQDGGFQAICVVTVQSTPVQGVSLSPATLEIFTGSTARTQAVLDPANASDRGVTFATSNPAVATVVGSGLWATVTAVSAGTATITVTTEDGGFQATCGVTVSDPPPQTIHVGGQFGMIMDGAAQPAYDGCDVYAVEIIDGVVHACGVTRGDSPRAVYWVDGVRSDLPMGSGATVSGAHGICAMGGDVYIAGWEAPSLGDANFDPWDFRPPLTSKARLWKNGANQEFNYPHNTENTVTHVGSYGLCLAAMWNPQLNREILWMGGNLKMTDGTDNSSVWIADPGYYGYQVISSSGDNQPPHFWSIAAEPAPARRLWTADMSFGLLVIDWDMGWIDQPYETFGAYSVKCLNGAIYAAGFEYYGTYPAAYLADGDIHVLEDGAGSDFMYSEAWDIDVGPNGVVTVCGADFFGYYDGPNAVITASSPRLWKHTAEQVVPGWTGDRSKGLAYAVAAINPSPVPVTGVTLPAAVAVNVNYYRYLTATVLPSGATNSAVSWSSSNETVAWVSPGAGQTATVWGLAPGTAMITVTTADGGFTASCAVTVDTASVTGVTISLDTLSLFTGRSGDITAAISPYDATNRELSWTSSDPAVATVTPASTTGATATVTVTGVAQGSATITAASLDGPTASVEVSVTDLNVKGPGVYVACDIGLFKDGAYVIDDMFFNDVYVDQQYNVHATGFRHYDHMGVYLLNVVTTDLPREPWATEVYGASMAVLDNGDVYIAGHQYAGQPYKFQATLWKNGELQVLESADALTSQATSVAVHGGNVYVAGAYINSLGKVEPCLWLNGQFLPFGPEFQDEFYATLSIAVADDGTVYVGGDFGVVAVDVANGTYEDILDSNGNPYTSYTLGVCAVGNDMYAVGWTGNDAVYYDQFHNMHVLPRAQNVWAEAQGVRVTDTGDVYIAGRDSNGQRLVVWVNGVLQPLEQNVYSGGIYAYVAHARGVTTGHVPVAGVTLSSYDVTIPVGGTASITGAVTPADATNQSLTWFIDNTAKSDVSGNTLAISGLAVGQHVVKARAFNGAEATCNVTVAVFAVSPKIAELVPGGTLAFTANTAVAWTTTGGSITADGLYTAPTATGTYTVTATSLEHASMSDTATVTVAPAGAQAVYVAGCVGSDYRSYAALWRDGVKLWASNVESKAYSVFASGSDVYVAGITGDAFERKSMRATLWKNGDPQLLGDVESRAYSVFVSGDDVYVAGYSGEWWNYPAALWKNGQLQPLPDAWLANSVFVYGDDVYVAGDGEWFLNGSGFVIGAALWKNGALQPLPNGYAAYSVFVSDGDVYVGGNIERDGGAPGGAALWKNGAPQLLPAGNDAPYINDCSVFVSGDDVYVTAGEHEYDDYHGALNPRAVVWKNGARMQLSDADSLSESIFVCGSDVYVAGYTLTDGNWWENRATLWKNGIPQMLPSDAYSEAYSVFVR
jgi:uncharacterized protein YjdB